VKPEFNRTYVGYALRSESLSADVAIIFKRRRLRIRDWPAKIPDNGIKLAAAVFYRLRLPSPLPLSE